VLDFGTLEEALSAVDAVGNPSGSKGAFERTRLRVRTIEDRMVAPGAASGAGAPAAPAPSPQPFPDFR